MNVLLLLLHVFLDNPIDRSGVSRWWAFIHEPAVG